MASKELMVRFAGIVSTEVMKAARNSGPIRENNVELMESTASLFFEGEGKEEEDFLKSLVKAGYVLKHRIASWQWSVEKKVEGLTATISYIGGDVYIKIQNS